MFTDFINKNKNWQIKKNVINLGGVLQARKMLSADPPKFKLSYAKHCLCGPWMSKYSIAMSKKKKKNVYIKLYFIFHSSTTIKNLI